MTTAILVVTAIIFLAMAAGIFFQLRSTWRKIAVARATPTSSSTAVAGMDPGQSVEVQGTLRCDSPVVSELSKEPCAYFSTELIHEFEAHERAGSSPSRWVKRKETLAAHSERAGFRVEDAMGAVQVNPDGADVDAFEVVNRFDNDPGKQSILGSTLIEIGGLTLSGKRTLGYRHTEHILRLDEPVYVLGVVQNDHSIGRAPAGVNERPFLISYRPEDDAIQQVQSTQRSMRMWCGLCAAVGIVLLVAAVLVR
jgi:hypothetical protein